MATLDGIPKAKRGMKVQITTMLRQLDVAPILTDLMHFCRERATGAKA